MSIQLKNLLGVAGAGGASGVFGGAGNNYRLVAEKLEEWDIFYRFLEHNPDIKEKYQVYKTYEILKNDA